MANENTKRVTSKTALLLLIALGFVLAGFGVYYSYEPEPASDALVGLDAPEFSFALEGGASQTLQSLRGKVVLLNFWAYWCEPCREEMESLQKLEAHLQNRDFKLLMIHVGDEKAEALKVPHVPKNQVFDIPVSVLSAYGVSGLPYSVLIDKEGVIRADFKGPMDWMSEEVLQQVQEPLG